jgi:hypothetical protein
MLPRIVAEFAANEETKDARHPGCMDVLALSVLPSNRQMPTRTKLQGAAFLLLFAATAGALSPNGMLVFSVERLPWKNDPKGYRLHPHGRYSHSQSYVDSTMLDAGFDNAEFKDVTLRMEIGEKVAGFIVSAVRHHAA